MNRWIIKQRFQSQVPFLKVIGEKSANFGSYGQSENRDIVNHVHDAVHIINFNFGSEATSDSISRMNEHIRACARVCVHVPLRHVQRMHEKSIQFNVKCMWELLKYPWYRSICYMHAACRSIWYGICAATIWKISTLRHKICWLAILANQMWHIQVFGEIWHNSQYGYLSHKIIPGISICTHHIHTTIYI